MKTRHMPPDEGLKEPVRKFEDTFSAETVVMETFFPDRTRREVNRAIEQIEAGDFDEVDPMTGQLRSRNMTDEIDALASLAKALRETIHQHPSLAEPINQVARNVTKLMKTPGDEKLRRDTARMIESLLFAIENAPKGAA